MVLLLGPEEVEAFEVLIAYRAAHATPLIKANNGLRSMLRTEHAPIEVSQRLKRASTILDKLTRQPTMALSRMQDIGGCRAILDTVDQLRHVQARLTRNRALLRVDDYVSRPRDSGYRAVHLIVVYDERSIEVQLRTRYMHDWAVAVEQWGALVGEDLKSGRGPRPVLDWLSALGSALALEEAGEPVDSQLSAYISELRNQALPFLRRGTR